MTVSLALLWKLTWPPTTSDAIAPPHNSWTQALPRGFGKPYKSLIRWAHYLRCPSLAGSDPSRHQRLLVAHSSSPRVPSAGEQQLPVYLIPIDLLPLIQLQWHTNRATATCPSPPVSVSQCVFPSLVQGALTKPLNSTLAHLCIKLFPFIASPPALSHQTDREAQRGLHPGRLCRWKVLWSTRSTSCLPFSGAVPPNLQLIPHRRREHARKRAAIQNGYRSIRSTYTPS